MSTPDHLFRCSTRKAIDSLSRRFGLPVEPFMQDWEWEVADPDRIDEFLAAYEHDDLDDDERFTLMEMIIQSFEDLPDPPETDERWKSVLKLLKTNSALHISTIWYWASLGAPNLEDAFNVAGTLRKLLSTLPQYRAEQASGGNGGQRR
jgi:hypothetical protein